jgi:hypothetical protein
MRILFAGTDTNTRGGANDIVATDVKLNRLNELIDANAEFGYDWWHIYDTMVREIVIAGRFKAIQVVKNKIN